MYHSEKKSHASAKTVPGTTIRIRARAAKTVPTSVAGENRCTPNELQHTRQQQRERSEHARISRAITCTENENQFDKRAQTQRPRPTVAVACLPSTRPPTRPPARPLLPPRRPPSTMRLARRSVSPAVPLAHWYLWHGVVRVCVLCGGGGVVCVVVRA